MNGKLIKTNHKMPSWNPKTGHVYQRSVRGHSPKHDRKFDTVIYITPEKMRQVWRVVTYPWVHILQSDGTYTKHTKWVLVRERLLATEEQSKL